MERFWSKVDASGDCWEWKAALKQGGYGYFWYQGRMHLAHRMAWVLLVGEPPRMIDHICRNRRCVNPDHLQPTNHSHNAKGAGTGKWKRSDECLRGHPLAGDNLYRQPGTNRRHCKACRSVNQARYMERKRRSAR